MLLPALLPLRLSLGVVMSLLPQLLLLQLLPHVIRLTGSAGGGGPNAFPRGQMHPCPLQTHRCHMHLCVWSELCPAASALSRCYLLAASVLPCTHMASCHIVSCRCFQDRATYVTALGSLQKSSSLQSHTLLWGSGEYTHAFHSTQSDTATATATIRDL